MASLEPAEALGRVKQRKAVREHNVKLKLDTRKDNVEMGDVNLVDRQSTASESSHGRGNFKLGAGTVSAGDGDVPCMHYFDLDEEAIRTMFMDLDQDGNGMVTHDELLQCTKHTRYANLVRKHLGHAAFKGKDEINYSEFARYLAENGSFSKVYKRHIQFAVVVLYFLIGSLAYIYGDEKEVDCPDMPDAMTDPAYPGWTFEPVPDSPCTESWTVIDTMYFGAVTVTTVGYGDFGPSTDGMKVFTIFYVLVGLGVVGSIIASTASEILEAQQEALLEKMDDDPDDDEAPHGAKIFLSFFAIISTVFLGALFFCLNEDWSFTDGIYWTFITTTTVGYGDLSLTKESSRLFSFFFILTSTMVVAAMLGNLASISMEIKMEKKRRELMGRQLDMSMIAEMDANGDGVDAGEFLGAMLVMMGKIDEKDVEPILEKFYKLDEDGSGKLDADDLAQLAAAEEAKAKARMEAHAHGHH